MDAIQQTPGSRASNLQRYLDQARKAISEDNTGALASLLALFEVCTCCIHYIFVIYVWIRSNHRSCSSAVASLLTLLEVRPCYIHYIYTYNSWMDLFKSWVILSEKEKCTKGLLYFKVWGLWLTANTPEDTKPL